MSEDTPELVVDGFIRNIEALDSGVVVSVIVPYVFLDEEKSKIVLDEEGDPMLRAPVLEELDKIKEYNRLINSLHVGDIKLVK